MIFAAIPEYANTEKHQHFYLVFTEPMVSIYDQFIAICWQNLAQRNPQPKNYITINEVPALAREMEGVLGVLNLINKTEMQLVEQMARKKPTLRLFEKDVEKFFLRLVKMDTMEEFLKRRANTSTFTLTRLLDNLTTYSRIKVKTGQSFDDVLSSKYDMQRRPRSEPEREVKQEVEPTVPRLSSASELHGRLSEQQKKIAQLERLCQRYEEKLGRKGDDLERAKLLEDFKKALNEQDALIRLLQMKMSGKSTNADLVAKLPFIKQYLEYEKTKVWGNSTRFACNGTSVHFPHELS